MSTGFLRSRTPHGHLFVLVRLKNTVRGFFSQEMTPKAFPLQCFFRLVRRWIHAHRFVSLLPVAVSHEFS